MHMKHPIALPLLIALFMLLATNAMASFSGNGYVEQNGENVIIAGEEVTFSWNYSNFKTIRSIQATLNGTTIFNLTNPALQSSYTFTIDRSLYGALMIKIDYINKYGTRLGGTSTTYVNPPDEVIYDQESLAFYSISAGAATFLRPKVAAPTAIIPNTIIKDQKKYDVTAIGQGAFYNNNSLKTLYMSNCITSIDDTAFLKSNALTDIYLDIQNPDCYLAINKFNNSTLESLTWHYDLKTSDYMFPEQIHIIDEEAFSQTAVKLLVIPANVETIKARAFADCKDLIVVELENSDITIEGNPFQNEHGCFFICEKGSSIDTWATDHGVNVLYK